MTGEVLVLIDPLNHTTKNHLDHWAYKPNQQSAELLCVCAVSLCTKVYNTAQKSLYNFSSYPSDNCHCLEVVCWSER